MNENAILESQFGGSWWRKDEGGYINLAAGFHSDGEPLGGWWIRVRPRKVVVVHAELNTRDDEMNDFRAALAWGEKLSRSFGPTAGVWKKCARCDRVATCLKAGRCLFQANSILD